MAKNCLGNAAPILCPVPPATMMAVFFMRWFTNAM